MKLIEWYIFRRVAVSFVGMLTAITAIVWIVQGLNRLNIATDSGSTMVSFLYVATLLIPSVVPLIMPFALLLATVQIFKAMNSDSELAVIKASGGPKRLTIKPVLLLALIAGLASFALENGVTPYSRQEFRTFVADVRANLLTSLLQEGTFQTIDSGLTVHIAERLPNGGFGGLFISDRRETDVELSYFATEASIVEDDYGRQLLFMRDGELHQKDTDDGAVSIVKFNSYAFDLSAFAPTAEAYIVYPKDQTTAYLLNPDPENPRYQENPLEFTAEFHKRMTSWTLPVVFAMIALLLAGEVRTARQVSFALTGNAMALGMGYFLLVYTTQDMATGSLLGIFSLYAVPIVAVAAIGFLLATDRAPGMPAAASTALRPFGRIADNLHRIGSRRGGSGAAS
ncbi:LptF/LptG family permease [Pararhizobium haloflavum]|uniref:LptF/LptG family permease n=1 Tax=Pararhizobium haloflavum TaxID=2037914 RepID=UPI000C19D4D0|nr:LptF/LptG family permease [Pararhizobium haloflavum]